MSQSSGNEWKWEGFSPDGYVDVLAGRVHLSPEGHFLDFGDSFGGCLELSSGLHAFGEPILEDVIDEWKDRLQRIEVWRERREI